MAIVVDNLLDNEALGLEDNITGSKTNKNGQMPIKTTVVKDLLIGVQLGFLHQIIDKEEECEQEGGAEEDEEEWILNIAKDCLLQSVTAVPEDGSNSPGSTSSNKEWLKEQCQHVLYPNRANRNKQMKVCLKRSMNPTNKAKKRSMTQMSWWQREKINQKNMRERKKMTKSQGKMNQLINQSTSDRVLK